jgi:hydroxymethylglutaryl-CoA reductase
MNKTSTISGFYKLPLKKRIEIVKEFAQLTPEETDMLTSFHALSAVTADQMIENVVGCFQLPLGIATNFQINNKAYLIPMAIEESSVVAAASNAAKMALVKGGFKTTTSDPLMIGQIQVLNPDPAKINDINKHKKEILDHANMQDKILVKLGGGAQDITIRQITPNMIAIHLLVNVLDAMGANAVNTMVEAVAPLIETITGGRVLLRILSNLAEYRTAEATAVFGKDAIGGEQVVDDMIHAYTFAAHDPYRAATHNKGIMNGIDAVVIATGNDWRAIESGAHAYAAQQGYTSLTKWHKNPQGDLVGHIKIPMPVGIIGGATVIHPMAQLSLKILGIKKAADLAGVIAAVGLAQNFAAMRALVTRGIQAGHMRLHAKNIAYMAGAVNKEIDEVASLMIKEKNIRMDRAKEIIKTLRGK